MPPSLPPLPSLFLALWVRGYGAREFLRDIPWRGWTSCPYTLVIFRAPSPVADCPGGTSNTIGTPCLRLVLSDWRGLRGSLQPVSSILPFRHIVPQATGPFGGWDLRGLPFPTGRFRDSLGPGLSRLPPLQLFIKLPAKYFLSFRLSIGWHVPLL